MPVTSKDIADHLGVNQSTVSRALAGKLVSKEMVEKVRRAAEELGYSPNIGARIMATGRTGLYGLLVPRVTNPYYARFVERFTALALEQDGYHLALGCFLEDVEEYKKYFRLFLKEQRVDGLTVFGGHRPYLQVLAEVTKDDIPVVLMGETLLPCIHTTGMDHERGWYDVAKHLIGLGHKRIGLIIDYLGFDPKEVEPPMDRRFFGFNHAINESGIDWNKDWFFPCNTSVEAGAEGAYKLLAMKPRPTAIFAGNDLMALGVISAARHMGLRVPEDVSVAGYDNTSFAEAFDLTTVENLSDEIIGAPLSIMRRVLHGECESGQSLSLRFPPKLVVRSSTGPCPE